MTRRKDEYVSLEDRAEQANVSSADLFVSIHYNSARPDRGPNGIETYCMTPAGTPSTGGSAGRISDYQLNPGNKKDIYNVLLAYSIQHSVLKNLEISDRGVKRARFVVLKETRRPAVLVECGFLSNPAEQSRIRNPAYREKLAQSIYRGILKFVGHVNPKKTS
jgi:N-acetylmuramoyl-L-alanine amidase